MLEISIRRHERGPGRSDGTIPDGTTHPQVARSSSSAPSRTKAAKHTAAKGQGRLLYSFSFNVYAILSPAASHPPGGLATRRLHRPVLLGMTVVEHTPDTESDEGNLGQGGGPQRRSSQQRSSVDTLYGNEAGDVTVTPAGAPVTLPPGFATHPGSAAAAVAAAASMAKPNRPRDSESNALRELWEAFDRARRDVEAYGTADSQVYTMAHANSSAPAGNNASTSGSYRTTSPVAALQPPRAPPVMQHPAPSALPLPPQAPPHAAAFTANEPQTSREAGPTHPQAAQSVKTFVTVSGFPSGHFSHAQV